ncbi:MAG: M3 family metallopeptidase, partial [Actinomycetaceae bacterium]
MTIPAPEGADLPGSNPFSRPSPLPFGMPEFDRIESGHLLPALRAGRAIQRAEWEAVATSDDDPTIENTLEAIERSGELLARAAVVAGTLESSVGGEENDRIAAEDAPEAAEHSDAFWLDARIYRRFVALAEQDLSERDAWAV